MLCYLIGDQYDIVILTTVRSLPTEDIINPELVQPDRKWMTDNLGFLMDAHQINVGITRAKYGLIIIGKLFIIIAPFYGEYWQFITYKVVYIKIEYWEHYCIDCINPKEHLEILYNINAFICYITLIKGYIYFPFFTGNTTLLKYDKTWKSLLDIYEEYGCIKYGADLSKSQLNRLL